MADKDKGFDFGDSMKGALKDAVNLESAGSAFFSQDLVPAKLKSVKLGTEKDSDGTDKRVASCTFVIDPLPPMLAEQISTRMAQHIFNFDGLKGDERAGAPARSELSEIGFNLAVETQNMAFNSHPELTDGGLIEKVRIESIKVKAKEVETLELSFVAKFDVDVSSIEVKAHLIIRLLGEIAYLTFQAAQPFLGEDE